MNTVLPITIVIVLGGLGGAVLHRVRWPLSIRAVAAAALATVVWGCGTYAIMWVTAPNELGPPLPGPVFMTFLIALPPALLMGWASRSRSREEATNK